MGRYVTVSAKARESCWRRRLGISFSEVLRRALEEEVRRRKLMLLEERLREMRGTLAKIDVDEVVRATREDREAR